MANNSYSRPLVYKVGDVVPRLHQLLAEATTDDNHNQSRPFAHIHEHTHKARTITVHNHRHFHGDRGSRHHPETAQPLD